jgi:hypothetical protein
VNHTLFLKFLVWWASKQKQFHPRFKFQWHQSYFLFFPCGSMHSLHFIFPNHWFCMSTDFTSIICIFKLTTDVPSLQKGLWCLGWQNSGTQSGDSKNMTLLGGILLKSLLISQ